MEYMESKVHKADVKKEENKNTMRLVHQWKIKTPSLKSIFLVPIGVQLKGVQIVAVLKNKSYLE